MLYENDGVYIAGLTGMSGAGKTTACRVFGECGFTVLDCDKVARKVVEPGRPALKEITDHFSVSVLTADGELDRRALASIVFGNEEKLQKLGSIIYPFITYYIINAVCGYAADGRKLVLLDAPTLFESGADILCDTVVSVTADRKVCAERIMKRDGLTCSQADARLSSQHDASFYEQRSEYCAVNNGTEEEFIPVLREIAENIKTTASIGQRRKV